MVKHMLRRLILWALDEETPPAPKETPLAPARQILNEWLNGPAEPVRREE